MEILFIYLSGFSTCAVIVGTLWFLQWCESVKENKALRQENAQMRAKDQDHRQMAASLLVRMQEFRLSQRGKGALPSPASPMAIRPEVNMQHFSQRTRN